MDEDFEEIKTKVENYSELAISKLRKTALDIVDSGLNAIDTKKVVREQVSVVGNKLCIGKNICSIKETERVFVIAAGKCSVEASEVLEKVLGGKLKGGIALDVNMPEKCATQKIQCFSGTHPMPSDKNIEITKKIIELLSGVTEKDLVLFVVSGGGSTLLCLPEQGATCVDEKLILRELTKSGAPIQEINIVRKHMSLARGGFLAKRAYPAQVISLIISDVPGDDFSFIASGPTVKDESTVRDADAILSKYNVLKICGILHCGLIETPKEDKYFERVQNILLINNKMALDAMSARAKNLGYKPKIQTSRLKGEAREAGLKILEELRRENNKSALFYAGETTVTINGNGKGGRNQELSLSALRKIQEGELIVSIASDGWDNTNHAGALCDIIVKKQAASEGMLIEDFLNSNDSYAFFEKIGGYIRTGDTGSNVSDLVVAIKE